MELSFPKRYINTFAVDELETSIKKLNQNEDELSQSAPLLILYESVQVSPLKVAIKANAKSLYRLNDFVNRRSELKKPSSGKLKDLPVAQDVAFSSQQYKFLPAAVGSEGEVCFEPQSEEHIRDIIQDILISLHQLHTVAGVVHGHLSRDCVRIIMMNAMAETDDNRPRPRAILTHSVCTPHLFVEKSAPWKASSRIAAPEILARQPYGFSADIFGIGALVLDLVHIMLQDRNTSETTTPLTSEAMSGGGLGLREMQTLSARAQSFVMPCLRSDPGTRPSVLQLLMHPFVELPTPTSGLHNINTAPLGMTDMPPRSISALRSHADPRYAVEEEEEENDEESSDDEELDDESEDEEDESEEESENDSETD